MYHVVLCPTCHGQLKRAEVAAKLVAGRDHQLTDVSALDSLELQGVLIVVWHAHLVHPRSVEQHHPPPGEDRRDISQLELRRTKLSSEKLQSSAENMC